MTDKANVLYRERFSSQWRDAVPWISGIATASFFLAIGVYFSGVFSPRDADDLAVILCVMGIFFAILVVSIRSTQENGEVIVTENGITIIHEAKEHFFSKGEIKEIVKKGLYRGNDRFSIFISDNEPTKLAGGLIQTVPWSGRERVRIVPHHLPYIGGYFLGIILRTIEEDAPRKRFQAPPCPIFIPTKDPDGLLAAAEKMKR